MKLSPATPVIFALSFLPSSTLAESERKILLKLYEDARGEDWKKKNGWTKKSPVCSWFGIRCRNGVPGDDSGVTDIDLSYNNLVGKLPQHLWHMRDLKNVTFKGNTIYEAGFKGMSTGSAVSPVETLILSENSLNSVKGISNANRALRKLHLTSNRIEGPAFEEIFKLTGLKDLYTSFNLIDGTIPTEIGNMKELQHLYCYGNQMTGSLPTELGKLEQMRIITFAENKLNGTIPAEVNDMKNLRTFSVHNHDDNTGTLTGELPTFENLEYLYEIFLGGNALMGTIPPKLLDRASTGNEIMIGLANNELMGAIPSRLSRFNKLTLNVVGNKIDYIPPELCANKGWMGGDVAKYDCRAIMCPAGTWAKEGRQTDDVECEKCPNGRNDSPFLGAMDCKPGQPVEGVDETGGTYQDNPTGETKGGVSDDPLAGALEEGEGGSGNEGWKIALGIIFGLGGVIVLAFVALKVKSRRQHSRDSDFRDDDSIVRDMRDVM